MFVDDLSKDQAIKLFDSKWWAGLTAREVVNVQLFTSRLIMPFGDYHKAIEEALGRPVWTHEFAQSEQLQREFLKMKPAPTWQEILDIIPEEKRLVVAVL